MRIAIIGAGVSGLGAAYRLKRAQESGSSLEFTVFEASDRIGGQLWTERVEVEGGSYICDGGSDSYLTAKPSIKRAATELGIADEITGSRDELKKTFIVKKSKLVELPDGIMMFAPTKILPLATTKLYSWPAKFRMALDLVIPRKNKKGAELIDESMASLVKRRLGVEAHDRLAEALVGGVNGSDTETMSVAATYPMLLEMEQKFGSLILGFLNQRKMTEEMKKKHPTPPGAKPRTFFSSFETGLGSFTDKLAERIGEEHIKRNKELVLIEHSDDYHLSFSDGSTERFDALILTCPSWKTAELLIVENKEISELLSITPFSSCATIIMGFNSRDVLADHSWHGILTPSVEKRRVTGVSLISSKWPKRAPEGSTLIRAFVGGPRDSSALDLSDEELIALCRKDFAEMLNIPLSAETNFARVFRFPRSMPQYTLGHNERMKRVFELVAKQKGLGLAGAAYKGVGVPNCFDSGEDAAEKVMNDLGVEFKKEEKAPAFGRR